MVRTCGKSAGRKNREKCFRNTSEGRISVGKPRKRWFDDVENGLKQMAGEKS
jgi:hypothetical protein